MKCKCGTKLVERMVPNMFDPEDRNLQKLIYCPFCDADRLFSIFNEEKDKVGLKMSWEKAKK